MTVIFTKSIHTCRQKTEKKLIEEEKQKRIEISEARGKVKRI